MYCENCGTELADDAGFCSNCGKEIRKKHKNIYIALVLTFILTGLGSIYAGNAKKGLVLLIVRLALGIIGIFISVFFALSVIVWAFAFYEAYRDVQTANGRSNPKLLDDFKGFSQNNKIITILIVVIILIFTVSGCYNALTLDTHSTDDSGTHYYVSNSGGGSSSYSSSSSSHYGGVDDSPSTIAKNDPDWYYDHYEYGDNDKIDEYLESQGYD